LKLSVATASLPVVGDPVRLAQIVANLLNNAAKYTEPGGQIEVKAWREAEQAALSVRDNGMGIDPELLPRIFELFTQGRRSLDRAQGGLGLGLSVVKSLVELHGGTVAAASGGAGTGSTFTVRLPLASIADAERAPQAPAAFAAAPRDPTRVLVVDDNQDAAELIAEGLRAYGLEARAVYDPVAALQQAPEFRPQVALLDIGLPVIDGFELAQQLRGTPGLESLRLIAITGYGQSADRSRSADAGFDDHLVKPIELEALLQSVARVVGRPAGAPPT
jgi:CheY-like chemotaxis protein